LLELVFDVLPFAFVLLFVSVFVFEFVFVFCAVAAIAKTRHAPNVGKTLDLI
jgi:hypothetical protein